jgi:hypothetical protein
VIGLGGYWTGPAAVGQKGRGPEGGAGVVGVAGGEGGPPPIPPFDITKGAGVYGASSLTGVVAEGGHSGVLATGPTGVIARGREIYGVIAEGWASGIFAHGHDGPAGIFHVDFPERKVPVPQVRLRPQPMWVPNEKPLASISIIDPQTLPLSRQEQGTGRRALEAFNRQNLVPFEGFGLRFGVRCWTPTE